MVIVVSFQRGVKALRVEIELYLQRKAQLLLDTADKEDMDGAQLLLVFFFVLSVPVDTITRRLGQPYTGSITSMYGPGA